MARFDTTPRAPEPGVEKSDPCAQIKLGLPALKADNRVVVKGALN